MGRDRRRICFWALLRRRRSEAGRASGTWAAGATSGEALQLEIIGIQIWIVGPSAVHAFSFRKMLFGGKFWPSFSKGYSSWLSGVRGKGRGATSSLWKRGLSRAEVYTSWSPRSGGGTASSFSTAPFRKDVSPSHFIFYSQSKAKPHARLRLAEALLQRADLLPRLYLVGWICFTCI